jgi:anti-sigma B factor antagonist
LTTIELTRESGVAVIVPAARRLDAAVAPAFKQEVVEVVRNGEQCLVIDLSRVTFVDSSGLGALVSILKALGGQGALAVCGVEGPVKALFQLTRMDKVFSMFPDRESAVGRLSAR